MCSIFGVAHLSMRREKALRALGATGAVISWLMIAGAFNEAPFPILVAVVPIALGIGAITPFVGIAIGASAYPYIIVMSSQYGTKWATPLLGASVSVGVILEIVDRMRHRSEGRRLRDFKRVVRRPSVMAKFALVVGIIIMYSGFVPPVAPHNKLLHGTILLIFVGTGFALLFAFLDSRE